MWRFEYDFTERIRKWISKIDDLEEYLPLLSDESKFVTGQNIVVDDG